MADEDSRGNGHNRDRGSADIHLVLNGKKSRYRKPAVLAFVSACGSLIQLRNPELAPKNP